MKRRFARIALSVVVVIVMITSAAFAADKAAKKSDTQDPKAQQDAMMEMMMKAAAPGPMHELLKPMAGNWKTTAKSWMQPGTEPQVSEGTCESTWILGNRYLQSSYKGDMGGMPFEGVGITADRIEARLERASGKWTEHDVAQLIVIFKSIQRGEVTAEDEYPAPRVSADELIGGGAKSKPAAEPTQ